VIVSTAGMFAVVGRLALADHLEEGAVVVDGGRIIEVVRSPREGNLPTRVLRAEIVAPGLIDLQVNGGFGVEVGRDPSAIAVLAHRLPQTGVTGFLPTLISSPADAYPRLFAEVAAASGGPGAAPLGLHLEGPFLAPARKGAHPLAAIEAADDRLFDGVLAEEAVRLATLAPERAGALGRIRRLRQRGVVVSLGHTEATAEAFAAGVDAGGEMATHLYNAMSPLGHRAPGAVGAALADERVTVGLIADGVHVHPVALRLAWLAKGPERIALVSDMMAAAGMPPGEYRLGPQAVLVDQTSARLGDGTLAGSILTLDRAVRNVVRWLDLPVAVALRMATETPARLLGLADRGRLVAGARADLALFDADLAVTATVIGGSLSEPPPEQRRSLS